MKKKTKLAILGIIALILVTIGITYAYWLVTKTQTKENVISSACLDIAISGEKNDISLTNQFPMSDEEGMKLIPYEFTVTNNCNTSIDYQVALEAIGTESSAIATSALKVALDDTITILSDNTEVTTPISEAYESRKLLVGTLAAKDSEGSSATYELRIWIDEDAPISEVDKTFNSKISVTIGQGIEIPKKEETLAAGFYVYNNDITFTWIELVENGDITLDETIIVGYNDSFADEGTLVIDNNVTGIGDGVFMDMTNIRCVIMPEGVKTIGNDAFCQSSLSEITLPSSITSIGSNAFGYGTLTSINYMGTIEQWNAIEFSENWNYECYEITVHCIDGDILIPAP